MASQDDFKNDEWPQVFNPRSKAAFHWKDTTKKPMAPSKAPGDDVKVDINKERELADKTRAAARTKLEKEKAEHGEAPPHHRRYGEKPSKVEKLRNVANKASDRAFGLRGGLGYRGERRKIDSESRLAAYMSAHGGEAPPEGLKLTPRKEHHLRRAAFTNELPPLPENYYTGIIDVLIESGQIQTLEDLEMLVQTLGNALDSLD